MPAQRGKVGMDHEHYVWSPITERPPLRWPDGAHLALGVMVDLEYFEVTPPPGAVQSRDMQGGLGARLYPDYARLSHREYGHRVGIFRVLDVLGKHGIPPMVAVDAMTAEEYPFLVEHCRERGCEFIAHGIAVTRMISSRMTEDDERAYIAESLQRLRSATGVAPVGWFSPEYGESERTPRLLAEAGMRYVCDWVNDEQPYPMTVPTGSLYALPISVEFDDAYALSLRGVTLDRYERMLLEGADRLHADGAATGRLMLLNLRPWLIGQPFRIGLLDRVLGTIARRPKTWLATGAQIIDWIAKARAGAAAPAATRR